MENFGKTAVFPGGFDRIGEIPCAHGGFDWLRIDYCDERLVY